MILSVVFMLRLFGGRFPEAEVTVCLLGVHILTVMCNNAPYWTGRQNALIYMSCQCVPNPRLYYNHTIYHWTH